MRFTTIIFLAGATAWSTFPANAGLGDGLNFAPKLTLTCLDLQVHSDNSADLTCKIQNTSTMTGGNAPVIKGVVLQLDGTASYPAGDIGASGTASVSLHFPPNTYAVPAGHQYYAYGIADDARYGNIYPGPAVPPPPPTGQTTLSNSLQSDNSNQPPQFRVLAPCTYEGTPSMSPLSFPNSGGSAYIVVDTEAKAGDAPAGCPWVGATMDGGSTIANFSGSGSSFPASIGPGQIPFTVLPNTKLNGSTSARTYAVDIVPAVLLKPYHGRFSFTQAGLTCGWSATGFTAPVSGFSAANPGVITVTTQPGCNWSVTKATGVTIVGGIGNVFVGSGTVLYTLPANSNPTPQNVSVSLGNITVSAVQPPGPVTVSFATSPVPLSIQVDGTTYTTPQTFQWPVGSSHSIGAPSPQGTGGTRYVFSSWSQGGGQTQTVAPTRNVNYTASFVTQYQLTVTSSAGGSTTPASGGFYREGAMVGVNATAAAGYVFDNWTGPVAYPNATSTTVMMNGPETVEANFVQGTPVMVTIKASPALTGAPGLQVMVDGLLYATPKSFKWLSGSSHAIAAQSPQAGSNDTRYVFASWSQGGSQSQTVAPTSTVTYTEQFNTQYQLTTAVSPAYAGAITPSGAAFYDAGTSVPVTTVPESVYVFLGWYGSLDPNPSTNFVMNGAQLATAVYGFPTPFPLLVSTGSSDYTDTAGNVWHGITGFGSWFFENVGGTAGQPSAIASSLIGGTNDPGLYQSQRISYEPFEFRAPVSTGWIQLILKFADDGLSDPAAFNLSVNGQPALTNFDRHYVAGSYAADLGAASAAFDEVIPVYSTSNELAVRWDPLPDREAAINAIDVTFLPYQFSTDIRIKAGGPGLVDSSALTNSGVLWDGDHNYSGGQTFSTTMPISGPTVNQQPLYQSVRYNAGPLDYTFPVVNGKYNVVLKFAEIQNPTVGNTFNVIISGLPVLNNFNVLSAAGGAYKAIDKYFQTTVQGGQINIHFDGQPEIAAIEIYSLP